MSNVISDVMSLTSLYSRLQKKKVTLRCNLYINPKVTIKFKNGLNKNYNLMVDRSIFKFEIFVLKLCKKIKAVDYESTMRRFPLFTHSCKLDYNIT